jgi:hypothetical protein
MAIIHNNTAIYYSSHTTLLTNLYSVTPWNTSVSYPMEYIFSICMILCSWPAGKVFMTYVFYMMQDQGYEYMDVMESETKYSEVMSPNMYEKTQTIQPPHLSY